jgi:hypothetical protein
MNDNGNAGGNENDGKKANRDDDKGKYPNDNKTIGATVSRINPSPIATPTVDEMSLRNTISK